jgi:hypothetical protein
MPRAAILVLLTIGCSSPKEDPPVVIVAEDSTPEAETAPTAETPTRNPAGDCPACEATKCRAELDACAKDSTCVNWLLCMNECFRKPGASACQQKCTEAAKTPRAEAMTACKKEKCTTECTPLD